MGDLVAHAAPGAATRNGRAAGRWLLGAFAAVALAPLALRWAGVDQAWSAATYLPLHTVAEIAIALVGFATFAVQWYAAGIQGASEAKARFLGAAFLTVALVETCHLLAFPGMPGLFGPSSVERGISFWLAGRAWMLGALLVAAHLPAASDHVLLRRGPLVACSLVGFAAIVAIEQVVPAGTLFRPDTGLTPLKVGLEASLAAVALVGAAVEWRRWRVHGHPVHLRMASALGLAAVAEVCFSVYRSAFDLYNLLGHAYTLVSAALVFDALFVAALLEPYVRLERTRRDLAASNARLTELRLHVEGELASTIARLEQISAREEAARLELEAAFAAVPEALVVYSADGRVLHTNAAADRLFAPSAELDSDAIVQRWARLQFETTDGKPAPLEHNPIVRALRGETCPGVPLSLQAPDGRRLWVSVSAAPVRAPDGRLEGAVAAVADIGVIQQLQSQREDLVRAVSHDLRNPLQVTLLQAERLYRLLDGTPLERERASAARIAAAAKQMAAMIRDLVEAARVESGKLVMQPQDLELRPFIEQALAQAAGALEVSRVRVDIPDSCPPAFADPGRLERVILNLVGNALKYSPPGEEVQVTVTERGGGVQVSVTDRGPGIASEDLPYVFDRFYRGKGSHKAEGLGLGLYIVQLLVEAHGGRVWAESVPGAGATFRFVLPGRGAGRADPLAERPRAARPGPEGS